MADQKKTVLVTGATRGIGLAIAEHYITNGWNVIGAARNLNASDKLKALAPYKLVQLDAGDETSILEAAKELENEPIDLLINNAGFSKHESLTAVSKASLMAEFEVNAVGPFLVTRALLPNLRAAVAKNGSAIVGNISTCMGSIGDNRTGGMYAYRASKAALNMINASLALDLKTDKITTVVLHPGFVKTDATGHTGKITTEESVAGLYKVLSELQEGDTGKFFRYNGASMPW